MDQNEHKRINEKTRLIINVAQRQSVHQFFSSCLLLFHMWRSFSRDEPTKRGEPIHFATDNDDEDDADDVYVLHQWWCRAWKLKTMAHGLVTWYSRISFKCEAKVLNLNSHWQSVTALLNCFINDDLLLLIKSRLTFWDYFYVSISHEKNDITENIMRFIVGQFIKRLTRWIDPSTRKIPSECCEKKLQTKAHNNISIALWHHTDQNTATEFHCFTFRSRTKARSVQESKWKVIVLAIHWSSNSFYDVTHRNWEHFILIGCVSWAQKTRIDLSFRLIIARSIQN